MGRKATLKPDSFAPVNSAGASMELLPDLGQSLLESGNRPSLFIEPACFVDGYFYRDPNRLEISVTLPSHCATLVFPCESEREAAQRMSMLKRQGLSCQLEPDESLSYVTSRTKGCIVPLHVLPPERK